MSWCIKRAELVMKCVKGEKYNETSVYHLYVPSGVPTSLRLHNQIDKLSREMTRFLFCRFYDGVCVVEWSRGIDNPVHSTKGWFSFHMHSKQS